jgi:hypothetical protein
MGHQRWASWRTRAGLLLVAIPLAIATILASVQWGRGGSGSKADLDRTLGEQLELAAEFVREHGREMANQAGGVSAELATGRLGPDRRPGRRLVAFAELDLIAALRPDGTVVPIRSRLNPAAFRALRETIEPAVEAAKSGSGHEQHTVVELPSGLFLLGFHAPHGGGRGGLALGVSLTKEILEHFRELSAVEIGIFGRGPRSGISDFQVPAERCQECHDPQWEAVRPSSAFSVHRSFKSGTFYTRSLPDGFRYGFMGLKVAGRPVAMLGARKQEPQAFSARSEIFSLSSAPVVALLLAMVTAGGLLLRGGFGSLRHLRSPVELPGREGGSVASGVAIREQARAVVDGFGGIVEGAAESKAQMDRLHRQLCSIVEAQSQEAAEAEGRLAGLLDASHAFGQAPWGDELGESILRRAAELTRARWGRLALLRDGENGFQIFDLTPVGEIVRLANGAELDSVSRRVIQSAKPLVIRPAEAIDSASAFAGEGRRSGFMIAAPLVSGDRVMGAITLCERRGEDEFKRQDADTLGLLASHAALALDHANLYKRAQESYLQTTLSLVNAIEAKDRYLRGHSERVKAYSIAIARELEFDEKRIDNIQIAAELHDVGKVGIDLSVLNRRGPLTAREFSRLRRHPEVGRDIVKPLASLKEVGDYILQHHEWFNGAGYPSGLAGEQILLEARILAIADSFDAITSKRPYRPRRSAHDAFVELRACAGTQFDPALVEVAIRALTARGR